MCILFVNYRNFCASRRAYIKNYMALFCISFAHAHARNTCVRCFLLKALCFGLANFKLLLPLVGLMLTYKIMMMMVMMIKDISLSKRPLCEIF